MQISIIICTRNRAEDVTLCLDSVATSIRFAPDILCEIILVDNGSTDETQNVIKGWAENNQDIQLHSVVEPCVGLSRSRNTGLSVAKGDLLVFTDDDCRMDRHYISTAREYDLKDLTPVIRGGRIELGNPVDFPITIKVSDQIERWQKSEKPARNKPISGFISGANMMMRRSTASMLGKFDVLLGAGTNIAGSEDTDYLCRAYINGIDIEYVPDMIARHFHGRRTQEQAHQLLKNYSIGAGAIYIKYLFHDFDLFRPFIWNIKNAMNEIKQSDNLYLPEYGLSYKNIVAYNIYGMCLYIFYSALLNKFSRPAP